MPAKLITIPDEFDPSSRARPPSKKSPDYHDISSFIRSINNAVETVQKHLPAAGSGSTGQKSLHSHVDRSNGLTV